MMNHFPRRHWVAAIALCLTLALSVAAYADTYNFFFSKPHKKGSKKAAPVEPAEDSDDEESEAEPAPRQAEAEKKPEEKAAQGQTVTAPGGQGPIVIHNYNNNNVGTGGTPAAATPLPPPAASESSKTPDLMAGTTPGVDYSPDATSSVSVSSTEKKPRWRLGFSALWLSTSKAPDPEIPILPSYTSGTDYRYGAANWGGTVSLGYNLNHTFSGRFYVLANSGKTLTVGAGADCEALFLRVPVSEDYDLFQIGPVLGVITFTHESDNVFSLHGGVRANLNFGSSFGVTASARANLAFWMLEAGITTRL